MILSFLASTSDFEGYWIQKPEEELIECYGLNGTLLYCEQETVSVNGKDTYDILHHTISLTRDSNVVGHRSRTNEIHWGNNKTWIRRGTY